MSKGDLVFMGPPGSGKGTQAQTLVREGIVQLSTGELFRDNIKRGTALGQKAKAYIDRGDYVPDQVTVDMVREWLRGIPRETRIVFDGFPRTVAQAEALDAMLEAAGTPLERALNITAPLDVVVERLSTRLECPVCHRTYNPAGAAPKVAGMCDFDPGVALVTRKDDDLDKIRKRIEVFQAETAPLEGYYRRDGRLRDVEGLGATDDVFARVLDALGVAA